MAAELGCAACCRASLVKERRGAFWGARNRICRVDDGFLVLPCHPHGHQGVIDPLRRVGTTTLFRDRKSVPRQGSLAMPQDFPAHWGDAPAMQTRDLRPLPGGYGMGSGTLAAWIQQHLDKDAGVVPAPKEPDPDNARRELMYGYRSVATFVGKRESFAGEAFVFRLDSLAVTPNPASQNAKWVTPVAEGADHMIGRNDLYEHLVTAEALPVGARVKLEWNHDYVTVDGSSGPDRPVVALTQLPEGSVNESV